RFRPLCPPSSTLFPYTTLFRSQRIVRLGERRYLRALRQSQVPARGVRRIDREACIAEQRLECRQERRPILVVQPQRCADRQQARSEEHTSELQSRENLVCRLLL